MIIEGLRELCELKHKAIEEKLETQSRRLNKHSQEIENVREDIGTINTESASLKTEMKNVCKQLGELTSTLKWSMGILISLVSVALAFLR